MPRYADPALCPDCRTALPPQPASCPRCALPLRGPVAVSLLETLTRADLLLGELRASVGSPAVPVAPAASWPPARPPQPAQPPRTGLKGASVPRLLLGLGALCLLVAATTFLAVAWSWLGVEGRTAVLVALSGLTAGTALLLAHRGLRVGADALAAVALGLVALDVVGADRAGWWGGLEPGGFLVVLGLCLLGSGLALSAVDPGRRRSPGPDARSGRRSSSPPWV